jgi:hypothetical protein
MVKAMTISAPDRTEAAEYYFKYIEQVPKDDVLATLEQQLPETLDLLKGISDERSLYRYAPDKWTIRESVAHVNDAERLFVFRAFWFGRGLEAPLPSFDQDVAVKHAGSNACSWSGLVDEFRAVRLATLAFFRQLPADGWTRAGVASGNRCTVRALAYITAGHVAHHNAILRERYLAK